MVKLLSCEISSPLAFHNEKPKDQKEVKRMKKYTGMYILKPTLTEDQIKANVEELNALFTSRGGEILSEEEWGLKELAYEINDFSKGYYVKFTVNANNEAVAEYDRVCNIKETVIRHILVKDRKSVV